MRARQAAMDFKNEDLPLFSGTPMIVALPEIVQGNAQSGAQSSYFQCRFCKDGGHVAGGGYCFCEAGAAARLEAREKKESDE